jgi:mono/diheme cytochrome c family protein
MHHSFEGNDMSKYIVAGAMVCAAITVWAFGQVTSQQTPQQQMNAETVKLIDSVDGPTLYRTYCAVCHGTTGKGGGPLAESLKVPPSDLTRIASHNQGEFPLARVEKIIAGDEEVTKGHGPQTMPVWGPIFSQIAWDQDLGRLRIRNLAVYLKGIQAR